MADSVFTDDVHAEHSALHAPASGPAHQPRRAAAPEAVHNRPKIVPRENLDFRLSSGEIPRHWFGGDPFKTRFFDALSSLFPEGERFFIACVRDFREQITDPALRQDVQDFCKQEAHHSRQHMDFNAMLAAQGVKMDKLQANQHKHLFGFLRTRLSKEHTLALTAASEHMTAIMAHSFFERTDQFASADRNVRALFGWHAIEEVEHKAVAFDVMQQVAKVGYWQRVVAMVQVTIDFPRQVFQITNHMLKVDGFSRWQRAKLWAKGLWWLYAPGGLMGALIGPYLAWYRPSFHPWDIGQQASYPVWAEALALTGDPVEASEAVHLVAKRMSRR